MNENTITIPADLWSPDIRKWTPESLRNSAQQALEGRRIPYTAALLRRLADEIERQAPRPEGWYSIRYDDSGGHRTFLYWEASIGKWRESNGVLRDDYLRHDGAIIEPVTIGEATR